MPSVARAVPMALALMLAACGGDDSSGTPPPTGSGPTPSPSPTPTPSPSPTTTAVMQRVVAAFNNPWAMVFLPDGRLLVTEKPGSLFLVNTANGAKTQVSGVPAVVASGQIGLHDIVLDPAHATNRVVWLSYAEAAPGGQRIAVARATLDAGAAPQLQSPVVVWRSTPATTGGHMAARLAFAPDGRFLFISTGERQQGAPAQDLGGTLGKMVRINLDGTPGSGNPFATNANARAEIWSLGHRNPLGLAFAADGRLFSHEMGPQGGDEFNLIQAGSNYGWPQVSEGNNYDGTLIPRHATNPSFAAPLIAWTSTIAPSGMIQYRGTRFSGWNNDFVLGGLVQQGIVRVRVTGSTATEVGRIGLGARIREVEQAPDGRIWVLQDGNPANLVELTPQ